MTGRVGDAVRVDEVVQEGVGDTVRVGEGPGTKISRTQSRRKEKEKRTIAIRFNPGVLEIWTDMAQRRVGDAGPGVAWCTLVKGGGMTFEVRTIRT